MVKAIIIDDIESIRNHHKRLIGEYCKDITIISEATNVADAIQKINEYKPNLIFLDVELGNEKGFEVLEAFKDNLFFQTIFITAHQQYAIDAFEFSATDYLLKPLKEDHLLKAVERAERNIEKESNWLKIQTLLTNMKGDKSQKIILKTSEKIVSAEVDDIVRCEANQNYTMVYLKSDERLVVLKTISEYESLLKAHSFFRCHKSHLINMNYFKHYIKSSSTVVLNNDMEVPLAVRKQEELMQLLTK